MPMDIFSAMDNDQLPPEPPGVVDGLTHEERVDEFIRLLSEGNRVRAAAAAVGITPSALYRKRKTKPDFDKAWTDALRVTVEKLESEAMRRAMNGSDKLMEFMLKALAPEKYRERSETRLTGGVSLQVITGMPLPGEDMI